MTGTKRWDLPKSFTVLFMKNNISMEEKDKIHEDYILKNEITKSLPIYYIIEPTNHCNFACKICPNRFYSHDEKGYMSISLFEKIISQIGDIAEVIQLYWLGEPLLHPEIIDMISICKKKTHAKIMISTNGSLLDDTCARKMVDAGLDKLIVSMDAAESHSIYETIRCNGNIDALNNNVSNLLKYSDVLDITLQFILTFDNQSEREAFEKKWSQKGAKISIQCLYTWANQMPELNNYSNYLSPMLGEDQVPCADLWYKMAIHWNGKVSMCCFDWSFDNCIGDINIQTIASIWNDYKIVSLRNHHCNGSYPGICKKCDAWATEKEYDTLFD